MCAVGGDRAEIVRAIPLATAGGANDRLFEGTGKRIGESNSIGEEQKLKSQSLLCS